MSPASTTLLRLPIALHAQLRELAHVRRCTMVEVVEATIASAIRDGEFQPIETDFIIRAGQHTMHVHHRDMPELPLELDADEAKKFADGLEAIASDPNARLTPDVTTDKWFGFNRRGSAVSVEFEYGRHWKMPEADARLLAGMVRSAADDLT